MPTSRSPRQATKPPVDATRSRLIGLFILVVALAVLTVIVVVLPASTVQRLLPPFAAAEDFSGTLWHGSAGRVSVAGRDLGAVEWHLHPASLLHFAVAADVHWVKIGFVADGAVDVTRARLEVNNLTGGGPLEDLASAGVAAGWRGATHFKFKEVKLDLRNGSATLASLVGEFDVTDLVASMQVAGGANLGNFALTTANGAITPNAEAAAELVDTGGGPLAVQASIHFSVKDRTGVLSGTIRERAGAPPLLHDQLETLAQLHPRDAQGRIPVDLEFTL